MWRREYRDDDIPFVRSGEEENQGDDMAIAGFGGESTEMKNTYFCRGELENKGDDMALAGCGGDQRRRPSSCT
jgi:hypothetical protein